MKSKLFYRYFLSYLLILCVPLFGFYFFTQYYLIEEIQQNINTTYKIEVNRVEEILEQRLQNIEKISDFVISIVPPNFTTHIKKVEASVELIKILNLITISNQYLNDIAFLVQDDDYFYTSTTTYRMDNITNPKLYFSNLSKETLTKWLTNGKKYEFIATEIASIKDYPPSILFKVKTQLGKKNAYIFYFIDINNFFADFKDGSFVLKSNDGELLCATQSSSQYISEGDLVLDKAQPFKSISKHFPIEYISIKPEKDSTTVRIQTLMNTYYSFLIVLVILSILCVYLGMNLNYNPAQKIKTRTDTATLLLDFIKGQEIESFEKKEKEYNLKYLLLPNYFIILFKLSDNNFTSTLELEKLLKNYLSGYLLCLQANSKFCYIGSTKLSETEYIEKSKESWLALSKDYPNFEIAMTVSHLFQDLERVPICYERAILNLENSFICGKKCFLTENEEKIKGLSEVYTDKVIEKLKHLLKLGKSEEINPILEEYAASLKKSSLPIFYIKALCFNITQTLCKLFPECSVPDFSTFFVTNENITIDELIEEMRKILILIASENSQTDETINEILITNLNKYLDENIFKQTFSLQAMAETFDLSASALSTIYKKNTGKKLMDEVSKKRMKKATQLLIEGKCVYEIIPLVGYFNTSSFIRKFKSFYGVTPSNYVKIYKEENSLNSQNKDNEHE